MSRSRRKLSRYVVKPDGSGHWRVWDQELKEDAMGWQFTHKSFAEQAAGKMNKS